MMPDALQSMVLCDACGSASGGLRVLMCRHELVRCDAWICYTLRWLRCCVLHALGLPCAAASTREVNLCV